MSFELIYPALRPLRHLLEDETISEVGINGNGHLWIERNGSLEDILNVDLSAFNLKFACTTIARVLGDDISSERPLLDSRLPDGSRVAIVFPPVSVNGVTLTIRKFRPVQFTLDELVERGSMPAAVAGILRHAVQRRQTILVSGGTGSGKTTLLNAIANLIDSEERIGVIEDTAELRVTAKNVFRFEARRPLPGIPGISIRDLLKASLRHRPDRILVGEVRGGEAWDLIQAINTGHAGSLSTIHANSAHQALSRLATLTLQSDIDIPYRAIQSEIGDLINLVIQVERRKEGRRISQLMRVRGFDPDSGRYRTEMLYQAQVN
jgi:pilus assembly protein CpaF